MEPVNTDSMSANVSNRARESYDRLDNLIAQLHDFQSAHANLLQDNPQAQGYWHAGTQIVNALLMLKDAARQIRQGAEQ